MRYGRLRVTTPDGQVREHGLDVPAVTIGRSPENTIVVDDVSVSRRHARVTIDSGMAFIEDLGSENGIYLGTQRLSPNQRQLFGQNAVRVGSVEIAYLPPDSGSPASGGSRSNPAALPGAASAMPAGQSLAVTLRGPATPITAGGVGTATVQVHNRGTTVDEVSIAVVDLPPGWAEVTRNGIPLLPGARDEVTVMLRPPRSAAAAAGEHPFAVAVTSRATGTEIRTVGSLTLEPFAGMNASMQPVRSDRNFTIALENTGNAPLAIALSAQDEEGALRFEFGSLNVELPPGQRTTVRLQAKLPGAPKFGRELLRPFTVEVRQQGGSAERTRIAGQLRVKPPLQAWKMPAIALLVLSGLAGGGYTYARQCEAWSLPGCRDSGAGVPAGGDGTPVVAGGSPTAAGGGIPTQPGGGDGATPMVTQPGASQTVPGGGGESPTTAIGSATVTTPTTATEAPPTATPTPPSDLRFDKAEKVLDTNLDYVAIVTTTAGEFMIDLDVANAYATSNSFAFLAMKGFYDGLRFSALGGSVEFGDGDGKGTAGYTQPADFTGVANKRGTVGMVPIADDPGEVGSVWFVNLKDNVVFDTGGFAGVVRPVFATVTSGMDVVDALSSDDAVKGIEIRAKTVRPFPLPTLVFPFQTQPPILLP